MPTPTLKSYSYRATFLGQAQPPLIKRPLMLAEGTLNSNKPEEAIVNDLRDHLEANGIAKADIKTVTLTLLPQVRKVQGHTIDGEVLH